MKVTLEILVNTCHYQINRNVYIVIIILIIMETTIQQSKKIKGEQVLADINLSAWAKTETESKYQTQANKINEEIRNDY